jgi:ribonuclease P protein subunit POP4
LWVSYFDSILGIDGKVSASGSELAPDAIAAKSLKADLHGALVGIMKCCSRKHMEGMQGLIIIETEHTFRLVTAENKLLSVPKHGTLLALRHRGWVIAVNGSAIEYRPWDRALRKWKSDSTLCSL